MSARQEIAGDLKTFPITLGQLGDKRDRRGKVQETDRNLMHEAELQNLK